MAQLPYTKQAFIERVRKHLADDFPGEDFTVTDNEILLYIDTSIPSVLKGQLFETAKVTGVFDVPEAWLVTYSFTISNQSPKTLEYYVTLPQPPLALPSGYDITNVYLTDPSSGRSKNGLYVSAKRKAYRDNMPRPDGFFYSIEGKTMYLETADGSGLIGINLQVQMPISRTDDKTAAMNMPDDAIEPLFTKVVATILQRFNMPQDTVLDNLPAGNKTS